MNSVETGQNGGAKRDGLLNTVNRIAEKLLQSEFEEFEEDMYVCMAMLADGVDADRVYIWKNYRVDGDLYCTQIYEWSGGAESVQDSEYAVGISYKDDIPEWEEILSKGECINSIVREMSYASKKQLEPQGILSIFVVPVFLRGEFWGFIGFDDCHTERRFSENEESILRSAGLIIANSMLRNEMNLNLRTSAERLKTALEEARAANHAKSSFLSNMSHEIRTPMNAIIGMAELLSHERLNDRQKGYVSDIVLSARSLLAIVNDILDFSKIESGKMELSPTDYDFRGFIDNIGSMFVYVARKKGLEFRFECGENLPDYLYGDDVRLRQVLTNILGNAVKFTDKGYVRLSITAENGFISFEIKDTGKGIREEDVPMLFNAFEQVDKSKNRNVVGTGLGLAISRSFVELMGGDIELKSEYGKGTVFTVKVPIVKGSRVKSESMEQEKGNRVVYAPDADILIVDDNEFNLRVAHGLMGLLKINADTAESGAKAIEAVRRKDYDIVFMDHMMPDMDGVEATAKIRALGGKFETLPIIALTANAIAGAKEMFLQNGFDGFISKPIDSRELTVLLENRLPEEKVIRVDLGEGGGDAPSREKSAFRNKLDLIDELNAEIGLNRASGLEDVYRSSLTLFNEKLPAECAKMTEALAEKDPHAFAITVHAMKSALSTVGAMRLSETARDLELDAKSNHTDKCAEHYPAFEGKLLALYEQLSDVLRREEKPAAKKMKGNMSYLLEQAEKAVLSAEEFDSDDGFELLMGITEFDYGNELNDALEKIKNSFLEFDCGIAARGLRKIIASVSIDD